MDLSRDIRDYLIINQSISLPGLGSLYLRHVPAKLDKESTSIHAPSFNVEFDPTATNNEDIINHIASKYDLRKKEAKKEFNGFVFGILNHLLNYGKADIKGVGQLEQPVGENIRFNETEKDPLVRSLYLPSVEAKPIVRMAEVPEKQVKPEIAKVTPPPVSPQPPKKGMPEWLEYALPFLIFALVILVGWIAWNAYKNSLSGGTDENTEKLGDNPRLNKDPDSVFINEDNLYSKEDRDDSFNDESDLNSEAGLNGPSITPEIEEPETNTDDISENGNEIPSTSKDEVKSSDENINEPSGSTITDETSTPDDKGSDDSILEKSIASESFASSTEVDSDASDTGVASSGFEDSSLKPFHPKPFKCVIVVGSFKKSKYIDTMKEALEKLNYTHFTQSFGEFTRVGVLVECNNEGELLGHLNSIKTQVESNAWILH